MVAVTSANDAWNDRRQLNLKTHGFRLLDDIDLEYDLRGVALPPVRFPM
jgi:hypothetical protein